MNSQRNEPIPDAPLLAATSISQRSEKGLLKSLKKAGVITKEQRDQVLSIQAIEGGWIGRILLDYGFCSRLELYRQWAVVLDMDFVDLISEPPDDHLFNELNPAVMLDERWVPWHFSETAGDSTLLVAVSDPDTQIPASALATLGAHRVKYVFTTDWDILKAVSTAAGHKMAHHAAENLAETQPHLSASHGMSGLQKSALAMIALSMVSLMLWNHFVGLDLLLTILNVYFDLSIITKLLFSVVGGRQVRLQEEHRLQKIIEGGGTIKRRVDAAHLPRYTVLIPCYREANIIPQILKNMEQLDYPRSKLQVLLLLEEDDVESLEAAKATRTSDFMRIVVVPDGLPRTKARACNVGLSLATGEFLVIYDAEDRPEPGQLRDVIDRFDELGHDYVCLQARLNYFNAKQNFLTRMFTLEYSLWFDYLLLGVEKLNLPMPLGGTSNHFRTDALRTLGGWDPYNVTEDADLGIRSMALGYRIGAIESTTWEEACPEVRAWIRQRTRWIKGYMITATVHSRHLASLRRTTGWRGIASMVLFIGGTPATFLINPIVLAWGAYGVFGFPLHNFHLSGPVTAFNTFSLIFGNTTMIILSLMSVRRRKQWSLAGYAIFNPVFWLLHSVAAWRALWQMLRTPSEWEKTPHGLSVVDDGQGYAEESNGMIILRP
ncbi:MAG: glycosyltransferase [Acidobacteria bacterium]|nr:glycosyltransferase [Acidobacteriota bacterium]